MPSFLSKIYSITLSLPNNLISSRISVKAPKHANPAFLVDAPIDINPLSRIANFYEGFYFNK